MVKEVEKDSKKLYVCEECEYAYEEKDWADKCQQYCQEHHACSMEITEHAVPPD